MNFSQVLTITSLVSVQWPPIYRQVQDYLGKLTNIFDVDTVGAECFSPEFAKWARQDSTEDFCRLKARRCTAMGSIFIPAHCFAIS